MSALLLYANIDTKGALNNVKFVVGEPDTLNVSQLSKAISLELNNLVSNDSYYKKKGGKQKKTRKIRRKVNKKTNKSHRRTKRH